MWVRGMRHGDRAPVIVQAVARLVLNRRSRRLLDHPRQKPAPLNQHSFQHAVKQRPVVEAVGYITQKSFDGERGVLRIELDYERAAAGMQLDARLRRLRGNRFAVDGGQQCQKKQYAFHVELCTSKAIPDQTQPSYKIFQSAPSRIQYWRFFIFLDKSLLA